MTTIMYVETNIIALIILLLIFINIRQQEENYLIEQKLFWALLGSNALLLIFDTIICVINGRMGFLAREANLTVTFIYYILNPLPGMLWSFYADYQINRDERRLKQLLIPMLIPVCINAVLAFLSIFHNFVFYIDNKNIYHRGSLFFVTAAICYFYLVLTLILIIINHKKIDGNYFLPILVFAFPPIIGGIVQILLYGISLVWICMTISVLIIFINVQNNLLYIDHLTGLFNRRQLAYYLREITRSVTRKKLLAGIMIDINYFKDINDLYGHAAGDEALEHTGRILKSSFQKQDFISRYGGDEFLIIIEIDEKIQLINAINRIKENTQKFNTKEITPYYISLSIGYEIYSKSEMTIIQFIKHIDGLMYEDKKR